MKVTWLMMSSSVTAVLVPPSSSSTLYVGPKLPGQPLPTMHPGDIVPSLRIISIFCSGLNFMPSHCLHCLWHAFVQGSSAIDGGGSAAAPAIYSYGFIH